MLFRSFWTHQRSTEEMRPNLIAMEIKISNQARTYLARVLKLTSQWALHNANSKGTTPRKSAQLLQEQERNTQSADSMLFRSFRTHQRSTEEMRPNLIAMEIKISNQARTYLARVLKLTSQWALHNANSKGTTPRKSAQLLQEQERNTQSADSMLFRSFWTHQRSTEEMRPNLIAMEIKISNQARTYLARVLKLTSQWALHNANSKGTTPRKSAQLLQEQERNTQSADSMLFRSFRTHQRSTEEMRPNLIAMEIKISNQARTYLARVLKLTSQWALHNANSKGTTPRKSAQLLQEQERNTQSADSMLFRSFWTHQRSTEEMRPNLIAMEIKISNQAGTYLARVLKLTSQWALHNANSKGTTPRKSAQLLQEQERNTQSADSMLFRSFWTHQRSTEEMRPNLIAMEIKISNQARTYLARVLKLTQTIPSIT